MIDGNITTTRSERNSSDNAVILLMPQSESRRVHVFKLGRYVILHVGFIRQVSLNVRIKIIIKKTDKNNTGFLHRELGPPADRPDKKQRR